MFPGNDLLFSIVPLYPGHRVGLGTAERVNMRRQLGRSKTFALPFFHEEKEIDDIEDTQQG